MPARGVIDWQTYVAVLAHLISQHPRFQRQLKTPTHFYIAQNPNHTTEWPALQPDPFLATLAKRFAKWLFCLPSTFWR